MCNGRVLVRLPCDPRVILTWGQTPTDGRMRAHPFVFAAAIVVASACAHHPATRSVTELSPDAVSGDVQDASSPTSADSLDLSGRWVTGSDNEPAAREVRLPRDCRYTPAGWYLDQRGDSVYAWHEKEHWAKGVAERPEPRPASAVGRLRGHELELDDGSNHWRLRYDAGSWHLRGTFNGQTFWAMRQILEERKEQCIDVR